MHVNITDPARVVARRSGNLQRSFKLQTPCFRTVPNVSAHLAKLVDLPVVLVHDRSAFDEAVRRARTALEEMGRRLAEARAQLLEAQQGAVAIARSTAELGALVLQVQEQVLLERAEAGRLVQAMASAADAEAHRLLAATQVEVTVLRAALGELRLTAVDPVQVLDIRTRPDELVQERFAPGPLLGPDADDVAVG